MGKCTFPNADDVIQPDFAFWEKKIIILNSSLINCLIIKRSFKGNFNIFLINIFKMKPTPRGGLLGR